MDHLGKTWVILVALSVGTTVLTKTMPAGPVFVALVLGLSGLKARAILLDYLDLRHAPAFRGGFAAFLIGFLALAFGLYLAG